MWLVGLQLGAIQRYVFGSNVMREIVGASYLCRASTEEWPAEAVARVAPHSPGVFQSGGGRCLLVVETAAQKDNLLESISERLFQEARGLPLYAASVGFDWPIDGALSGAIAHVLRELHEVRNSAPVSRGDGATPVTVRCASSGEAAEILYPEADGVTVRPVSSAVACRRDAVGKANAFLKKSLALRAGYSFPLDVDHLGRSHGESSYLAVVHADGNGIGRRVATLAEGLRNRSSEDVTQAWRRFSQDVDAAGAGAMKSIARTLMDAHERGGLDSGISLSRDGADTLLPLRPLVFGGDDTTFLCDGRLALWAATTWLHNFRENMLLGEPLSASAGVAIAKTHYPFHRIYALAEELTESAKSIGRQSGECVLDWHIAQQGILGDLQEIRRHHYVGGTLLSRPLALGRDTTMAHSWETFRGICDEFAGPQWNGRRRHRSALLSRLPEGGSVTEAYRRRHSLPLLPVGPVSTEADDAARTGWANGQCLQFDALEALDFLAEPKA